MFSTPLYRVLACILSVGCLIDARAASPEADPAGRESLPAKEGFGAVATTVLPEGTTGGSAAASGRTVTVTNRKELVAALAWPDATPKLIYVKGMIDANTDDAGRHLDCKDYYRADPATGEMYSPVVFVAMYEPQGPLGKDKKTPFGGQEYARAASAAAQEARVHIRIPPNTTIYGLGSDATVIGAWLDIAGAATSGNQPLNVIVRNINFEDTADCFPEWSPTDGLTGDWNSSYDSISIRNATHVWIDHNRFADMHTRDETQPTYYGRRYQVHDGQLDITNEADFVTVSWNQFASHDKTMLIGNADELVADRGKLNVTIHHNFFDGVGQRAPRVRFGKVHVYDNVYRVTSATNYHSSWGLGIESQIYAESNYFDMNKIFGITEIIKREKGTKIADVGNCRRMPAGDCPKADIVVSWNARNEPDLDTNVGWTPTLYGAAPGAEPAEAAQERVMNESGPGRARRK